MKLPKAVQRPGAWNWKTALDGYDLATGSMKHLMAPAMRDWAIAHCLGTLFDAQTIWNMSVRDHTYVDGLDYECGLFVPGTHPESRYVLLNAEQQERWAAIGHVIRGLKFWTCPSYDRRGVLNNVGLRIIDVEQVAGAFKWLFVTGPTATFGAHMVREDEPVLVVEGYRDWVAATHMGLNAVALGSLWASDYQKEQLAGLNLIYCFDSDAAGMGRGCEMAASGERVQFLQGPAKDLWECFEQNQVPKFVAAE